MLSIQIADLRDAAKLYDHMVEPKTAKLLRGAADTIESLRDRLQADVLGSGTCNPVETATLENATAHVMECDMCGRTYEYVNGSYEHCPRCGRKAER